MADIKIYGVLTSATATGELARASQISVSGNSFNEDSNVQQVLELLISRSSEVPEGVVVDPNYVHTDNNYTDEERSIVITMQTSYPELLETIANLQASLIQLDPRTNRVKDTNVYQVVLDSMGEELDGYVVEHGDYGECYYDSGKIWYNDGSGDIVLGYPSTKVIYCNKITNKLYRWGVVDGKSDWIPLQESSDSGYQPVYSEGAITFVEGSGKEVPNYSDGAIIM